MNDIENAIKIKNLNEILNRLETVDILLGVVLDQFETELRDSEVKQLNEARQLYFKGDSLINNLRIRLSKEITPLEPDTHARIVGSNENNIVVVQFDDQNYIYDIHTDKKYASLEMAQGFINEYAFDKEVAQRVFNKNGKDFVEALLNTLVSYKKESVMLLNAHPRRIYYTTGIVDEAMKDLVNATL